MIKRHAAFASCFFLCVGFLLTPFTQSHAGEKKQDKKAVFSKSDQLTDKDEKDTNVLVANSPRKVYKVKLIEGKTYQIDLKSKDFDALLRLEDPQGKELATNDDTAGKLDSRLIYKINKTGDYRIIATCLAPKAGKFTLTIVEKDAATPAKEKLVFTAKPLEIKLKDGKASLDTELTGKEDVAYNRYHKVFAVKLEEGKTYRIEQRSKQGRSLDPYLFLQDADGNDLAANDDADLTTLDSRIVYKAAKTGMCRIIATFPDKQTGKFVLEISTEEKKEAKDGKQVRLNLAPTTFVLAGQAKQEEKKTASNFTGKAIPLTLKDGKLEQPGELDRDDLKVRFTDQDGMPSWYHYKVYTVQLEAGKIYRIDQRGAGDDPKFDPFLFLEDADGNQLKTDDDSGGGLNARIVYKPSKTGAYRLVATTIVPKQTGKFVLEFGAPSKSEAELADRFYRIRGFAALAPAQRTALVSEVIKLIKGAQGALTINDFDLIYQLAEEAELAGAIDTSRDVLEDGIKEFAAAKGGITQLTGRLEAAAKNLDKIGAKMEITGKTTDGKEFDLAKLKGKVVLVDFWATWCGPCIDELPNLEAAYKRYHGKGFEVIGVSLDKDSRKDEKQWAKDAANLAKFMEERKMPWACINIHDSMDLADKYKVNSIPYPVLVGRDGRVVSMRGRGPTLERLLDRLLNEKK